MGGSPARSVLVALFAAAVCLVGVNPAASAGALATPGTPLWESRYGLRNGFDYGATIAVSPDGSEVFVAGASSRPNSADDFATVAYDAHNGARLWTKRYNGPGDGTDDVSRVGVSPDGSTVFVTGISDGGSTSFDYATIAYDASTGAERWVQRYNGPSNGPDEAKDLAISADGSMVFVTGAASGWEPPQGAPPYDCATVAYDASTGTRLWVKAYDGQVSGQDWCNAVGVTPDGGTVFVTGLTQGSINSDDYVTLAYDASTGARLWSRRYNGRAYGPDDAFGLGVSPDGSTVFVTGTSLGSSGSLDYLTIAYERSRGRERWAERYDGPGHGLDRGLRVKTSPDGSTVFVAGYSTGVTTSFDYTTLAYDAATGARRWRTRYDGPGHDYDFGTGLGVSPDGSTVFVTGGSFSSDGWRSQDYATVAYAADTGTKLWVERYNGPADDDDSASALAVSPDGSRVFVTGQSNAGAFSTFATVAYRVA